MQDPGHLQGPPLAPDPPRRQRQERTVYTESQQKVLEGCFQEDQYPNYDKRLNLAETLGLKEQQLQTRSRNPHSPSRHLSTKRRMAPWTKITQAPGHYWIYRGPVPAKFFRSQWAWSG
ncbi:tetrapeptide repeat homeobox protein 2 isoform X2 [Hylobates moloch]|uniref:tetrapeptide repeat homeobox protein 2 isoform X2 n=1 Tax=Hylobates moloch TaxID=81572 RepID=UPI002674A82C|nr:tetrapeptide repeat homeobox protein 2 isoform X2 [Hylobates moloch]